MMALLLKEIRKVDLTNLLKNSFFQYLYYILLFTLVIAQIYYLWRRTINLNGFVFSDEYTYQKMTNEESSSNFEIPNYLYILQTRITNLFNLEIQYQLIRLQNLFAFVLGNFCIWRISLRFLNNKQSFAIFTIVHFFPANTYITFFMPEMQYYSIFWILMLFLFRFLERPIYNRAVIVGLIWAYLSLIKPHALFLLIGFIIFFIYLFSRDKENRLQLTINWGIIFTTGILSKILVSVAIDGQRGITLFGDYESVISENVPTPKLLELIELFLQSLAGQYLGVLIVFAIPVILFIICFFWKEEVQTKATLNQSFLILVYICLGVLLLVVAAFSTRILIVDPGQSITRIHERYYSFFYPIFILQLAHTWNYKYGHIEKREPQKFLVKLGFALSITMGFKYFQDNFAVNFIDSPSILAIVGNHKIAILYLTLSLLALSFLSSKRIVVLLCLLIQIPIYSYQGNVIINRNLQFWGLDTIYENGAIFAKSVIPSDELDKLEVVGRYQGNVVRVPFKLANAKILVNYPDANNKFNLASANRLSTWVLVFDSVEVYGDYVRVIRKEDFSLYELE